jgi:hypothetical protein
MCETQGENMVIKTSELKSVSKVLGMIPTTPLDDFVFIEPSEQRLYIANKETACRVDLNIENLSEEESTMVIDRAMFQHLINAADELTITKDYHYSAGQYSGYLEHNETLLESLDSIKSVFNTEDFELLFTTNDTILGKMSKASLFVNPDDNNMSQRGLHIIDKKISASSLFRIYTDEIDVETKEPLFLQHDVTKFIFELGDNTSILKNDRIIKVVNNNVEIMFTSILKVTPLMITSEKFVNSINDLRSKTNIKIDVKSILPKIDFMSFFSKKNANNLSTIKVDIDNNILYIMVGENKTEVPCSSTSELKEVEFNYDNLVLKDVLTKVNKDVSEVTMYVSNESNIFLVEFSKEQFVVLAKIKV